MLGLFPVEQPIETPAALVDERAGFDRFLVRAAAGRGPIQVQLMLLLFVALHAAEVLWPFMLLMLMLFVTVHSD